MKYKLNWRRLLSMVLTVFMIAGMVPTNIFASDAVTNGIQIISTDSDETADSTASTDSTASADSTASTDSTDTAGSTESTSATTEATEDSLDDASTVINPATSDVAKIGDVKYASLQEAVDDAVAGNTITLLANATGAGVVFENGDDVIIDLNGYTYTLSESVGSSAQYGTVGFYLWAGSKVTVKNGTINMIEDIADDDYTFFKMFHTYGDLTLTDVTLDCTNGVAYDGSTDVGFLAVESDNGTVTINGATSITNCSALSPETWTVCAYNTGAVTINTTGTIDGVIVSYGSGASVAIEAGNFTNSNTECAQLTQINSGAIAVTGGTFSEDPSAYLAFGKVYDENDTVVEGYVIETADDLLAFAAAVNAGDTFAGKTVKLGADIDLSGVEWTPIGNATYKFKGTFDGDSHTISNMTINVNDSTKNQFVGLFGYIANAVIKNLTVKDANITVVATGNEVYAGAIVGYHDQADNEITTLDNFVIKNVKINAEATTTYIGGAFGCLAKGNQNTVGVGITNGTIDGLTIVSNATSAGNVGGLIGKSYKVDPQKVSNVDITGLDIDFSGSDSKVGGVIGWDRSVSYNTDAKQGWYDDVHVTGTINENITSGSGSEVGGFVGVSHYYPKIYTNCSADVDVVTGNRAGGFVGTPCPNGWESQTDLYSNCTASGDVTAPVAGGFVGCAWLNNGVNSTLKLENVTATGVVNGSTHAGGLIGGAFGTNGCSNIIIKDSTASASVTGPNAANTAGVVGNSSMASGKFITLDNVTYTVEPSVNPAAAAKIYVAQVGETKYATIAEAITAANSGEVKTIILLNPVVLETDTTLDFTGLTVNGNGVYPAFRIQKGANVTVKGGEITNSDYVFVLGASDGSSAGYLTIESGKYHGNTTVASVTKGTLTITGGEFSVDPYNGSYDYLINCIDANYTDGSAKVVISGGIFHNWNPENNAAEGAGTNFCHEDNVAKYLGNDTYGIAKIYKVATKAELDAALTACAEGDIIKLIADFSVGTASYEINKAVTIDLNGHTLTTEGTYGGLRLKGGCTVKNGTIAHKGTVCAIKAWDVAELSDLVIEVAFKAEGKVIGGIVIQENAAGVDLIKNVTIQGKGLTNGIETFNCGNATEPVIGSMENVSIDAVGTGMLISAPVGTATGCTFTGGTSGIEIWIKGTYSAILDLVDCTVEGGVFAHNEFKEGVVNNGTLKLTVSGTTNVTTEDITLALTNDASKIEGILAEVKEAAVAKVGYTYYGNFKAAIEAANAIEGGATVTLLKDVTLGEKLTITGNVTISGAYTITRDDAYTGTLFAVNAGATLSLDGGLTIDGANEYTFNSELYAADLADWENPTASADNTKWFTPEEGAPVATAYMITTSGTVNLNKVTIKNHYSTNGSGIVSASKGAVVTLDDAQITHNASTSGSGLVVNASAGVWSREEELITVTMNEGTVIDGNHVGGNHGIFKIYMGTYFTMNGGEVKNTTGWNSNGTVVGIYHAVFTMNGGTICSNSSEYGPNNGRNAAIYGHSNHLFTMNGGTICHNTGRSKAGIDSPYSEIGYTGSTIINGGSVLENEIIGTWTNPDVSGGATLTITGGTFTQDVSQWLAPDTGLVYNETTGEYTTTDHVYNLYFRDPATGEQAAGVGPLQGNDPAGLVATGKLFYADYYDMELEVLSNAKIDDPIVVDYPMTINLNGYTLTGAAKDGTQVYPIIRVQGGADVTVKGGTVTNNDYVFVLGASDGSSAGNLTIESGTYTGETTVASVTKGTLTINGGEFAVTNDSTYLLNCIDANYKDGSAKIVVKGGKFYKFDPANNAAEGASTSFVAEGYKSVAEGDYYVASVDKDALAPIATITFTDSNSGEEVTLKYPSERFDSLQKLIGTNDYADFVPGATQSELLAYVAEGRASNIVMTLHDDIELDAPLYFYDKYYQTAAEYEITLNLNGHKITNAIPETASEFHTIVNKVDLTVVGGEIQSNANKGYAIYTEGGKLTVDGAKIVGINNGYAVVTWTAGDVITIEDGTVIEGRGALYIDGGATGTVNGGTFTMTVQTTNNQDNVVYVGGASELTINGGTFTTGDITGAQRIAVAALGTSKVTINGGTFTTGDITGAQRIAVAALGTSKVTINGGTFYGLTDDLATDDTAVITVSGGTFTGTRLREKVTTSTIEVTGGTFSYNPTEWCADGYKAVDNGNSTYSVVPNMIFKLHLTDPTTGEPATIPYLEGNNLAETVAQGKLFYGNYYKMTLEILDDCTIKETVVIDYPMTVNLNGKTITTAATEAGDYVDAFTILADVTITGEGTVDARPSHGYTFYVGDKNGTAGNLTIENGTFYGETSVVNNRLGTVTINGGTFEVSLENADDDYRYTLNCIDANYKNETAKIVVKGGTFKGFNPEDNAAEGANTNFVAEGYVSETADEGATYTVREYTYVEWVRDQLFAGNDVTLDRDITITDYDLVHAHEWPSNGDGKYTEVHGNGAIFHIIKPGVELDLNGHSITWDAHHDDYCNKRQVSLFMVTATGNEGENSDFTVIDSSENKTGKIDVYGMASGMYVVLKQAKGTIAGGTWTNYPCQTCEASNIFIYPSHGGTLEITGGTFEQKDSEYLIGWKGSSKETNDNGVGVDYDATKVIITGGTFVNFNPENVKFFDTANSGQETINGCALGYMAKDNGDGTYGIQPWDLVIRNVDDMLRFAAMVNAGEKFVGKTVKLGADIDLSGIEWSPIGGDSVYFAGEFDGQGYTISNLTQTTGARMGLFGLVEKAYIHNFTMKNVNFTVSENNARVGAIAGNLQYWNVVEDVTIDGINVTVNGNNGLIGSVAGYVWKSQLGNVDVKNAVYTVNGTGNVIGGNTGYGRAHIWDTGVTGNNANWLEGTVQTINGTEYVLQNYFVDCDVDDIEITLNGTGSEVGGFFGSDTYNSHSNYFVNCHVTGLDVTAAAGTSQIVGGFIAWNNGTTSAGTVNGFDGCSASGVINGANGTYGGFAGQVGGRACVYSNATANVNITCTGTAGGFVGATQAYATHKYTFTNCIATGDVSGTVAGGFAGKNGMSGDGKSVYVEIENCEATGKVNGTTYAGGLIGEVNTELPATNWNIVDSTGALTLSGNTASSKDNVTGTVVGYLIGYFDGVANGDAKEGNTVDLTLSSNTPDGSDIGTGTGHHINISSDTNVDDIKTYVAQIGETKYETLADAVTAAKNGETVTLISDVTLTAPVVILPKQQITLDLNGKIITGKVETEGIRGLITVLNNGMDVTSLTINANGGSIVYESTVNDTYAAIISNYGKLVINGGTYTNKVEGVNVSVVIDNANSYGTAVTTINGGTFECEGANSAAIRMQTNPNATWQNNVTVNDGTIRGILINGVYSADNSNINATLDINGGNITKVTAIEKDNMFLQVVVGRNGESNLLEAMKAGVKVDISGGIFNGIMAETLSGQFLDDTGMITLTGGTFDYNVNEYCADGYAAIYDGDDAGTWTVGKLTFGQNAQIRLIEPWGLKANAIVRLNAVGIDYNNLFDYGVYFIRQSEFDAYTVGKTQDDFTVEEIIGDADTTKLGKNEIVIQSDGYLAAIYDKQLYTYEFNDSVYVLYYIVSGEGDDPIFAPIRERQMSDLVVKQRENVELSAEEREVYKHMNLLEEHVLAYREGKNTDVSPLMDAPTLKEYGSITVASTDKYTFSHNNNIRLIEPWGLKVNCKISLNGEIIDYNSVDEYGVVILRDNGSTIESVNDLLAQEDAYIFSSKNGDATKDTQLSGYVTALYNKGIYTYELNTDIYVAFYVKDADGYHFGPLKTRNVYKLIPTIVGNEDEEMVYTDMLNLYIAVKAFRK